MSHRKLYLEGQRFSQLLVVRRYPSRVGYWICKCDCGKQKSMITRLLVKATSCGCDRPTIVGKRFGHLVVMARKGQDDYRCLCKCDCGKIILRFFEVLKRQGERASCGCQSQFVGKKFGKLTVIRRDTRRGRWICRCQCGKEKSVLKVTLKTTTSCGCDKPTRLPLGLRFGKLVIQEGTRDHYLCKCDCGNSILRSMKTLHKHGSSSSCGCVARKRATKYNALTNYIGFSFWRIKDPSRHVWTVVASTGIKKKKYKCVSDVGDIKFFTDRQIYKQWWKEKSINMVIKAYGGKCSCCGNSDPRFLTLDHKNNDGNKHRKNVTDTYRWAIANNFPDTLQLLCYNCNMGKSIYGVCPHVL